MKIKQWIFPLLVVLVCALWMASKTRVPVNAPGEMNIHGFGRLPVVYQGRLKPFDTLARNGLIVLSNKQTFVDATGKRQPAIRWLLDALSHAPATFEHKVFRIDNIRVLDKLGLKRREGYLYSINDFREGINGLDEDNKRIISLEPDQRDAFDNKVIEFSEKIELYRRFTESHRLLPVGNKEQIQAEIQRQQMLTRMAIPYSVPPQNEGEEWQPFMRAALSSLVGKENKPVQHLAKMLDAYQQGDVQTFNASLEEYQTLLTKMALPKTEHLDFEIFFNHFEPFYHAAVLYLFVFLLGCFSWLGWSKHFNRAAFLLLAFTAVIHTWALFARIALSGYPPVTNLYSSAIFIGWGCVLLGLVLEVVYKIGVGNLVASLAGFATLLIAHFLAGDGDTMEMMQAVLDTKFWLATHVTTVTLGYTATYFAGGLAMLYIIRGVFTTTLDKGTETILARMIYGVVCFALLLSFVGTVLGGLWADDSWGRFWGWDPKENGALMIVMWNAVILHARWGGLIRGRGLAVMAVFGNIITTWSWFGVNQLGVGLHAYGFMESTVWNIFLFVTSQIILMGIALIPQTSWRSYSKAGSGADPKSLQDLEPAPAD